MVEADRPVDVTGYPSGSLEVARATCLHVATLVGDLGDDVVVVGGLVPSLLCPDIELAGRHVAHPGTMDLDLGLSLAVLDQERYVALQRRLRSARFEPDTNLEGRLTRQRWRHPRGGTTVDFLISPTSKGVAPGTLQPLTGDLAAYVTKGLSLAFRDRLRIELAGTTITGEAATRSIWVCGPAAFIALKALSFRNRGEPKDAFDLVHVLMGFGLGVEDIAARADVLRDDEIFGEAQTVLLEDFGASDRLGVRRAGDFLLLDDENLRADIAGAVRALDASIARRR